MPKLYIGEYHDMVSTIRGSIEILLEPPIAEQSIEIGGKSRQSEAFSPDTCIVRLSSDADCIIAIGLDPDATDSLRRMTAGQERTIGVVAGSQMKIAVMAKPA
jgi:hypothetical protein